jgi:nucleoside-diphosphate-sugar epimerase
VAALGARLERARLEGGHALKVLVAGATGTLGRPLVAALLAGGHEVVGLTRWDSRAAELERAGATPLVADALDGERLRAAVVEARPEAIVDLLTALPRRGPVRTRDLVQTNRLRREATANLLAAANAAGTRRVVAESMIFAYGYGDHGERALAELDPPRGSDRGDAQGACLSLESQLLAASKRGELEGIALRYGAFYGSGVPSSEFMLTMLRRRMMALPGGGNGVIPWIELSDAVEATRLALERGRPGEIYNVADDEPVTVRSFVEETARVFGTPKPRAIPYWLARLTMPYAALILERTRLRVSNSKATTELGWVRRCPTFRAGLDAWRGSAAR